MIAAKFGLGVLAFVTSGLAWLLLIGAPMMIRDGEKELDLMSRVMILTFRFMGVACVALAIGTWMYCFTI
jgi:hypothetical protein